MGDESDQSQELYINDGVLVKSHTSYNNDVDFLNNLGTLSIVDYKLSLGKCIEWQQCDVSIESDDQEWAIVKDNKSEKGTLNGNTKARKTPVIQIPFKNLDSFKISKNDHQLTCIERGNSATIFYFQNGNANHLVGVLKKYLNTSMQKKDFYIVIDEKKAHTIENSFPELCFGNSRSDPVWGLFKNLHDNPYETTMCVFSKVADAFLHKPLSQEVENVAELLNLSLTSDELPDFHSRYLPEDYELITEKTLLPPRTFPPRSSPLTSEKWSAFFDDTGRISEPEILKNLIFNGGVSSEENLRAEVWKFLLGYYSWNSTFEEREVIKSQKQDEYFIMKQQWETMTVTQEDNFTAFKDKKSLIEKDVWRTDRHLPFYAGENNTNLKILHNILMTYVMYNFDLGYVQGMSDLLSPLLAELKNEVDTFWCFVGFMDKVYRNFDLDQANMKQQFQQLYCILCCIEPEFATYLKLKDSHSLSFCFPWLLIWFKREFSYDDIYVLWEALWTELPCKNFHLLICAAILDTEKETIMLKNYGFTEILKHINELANKIDLKMILTKAAGIYIQLSTATKIPAAVREIIGLEPILKVESNNSCNGISKEENNICEFQNLGLQQGAKIVPEESLELAFDASINLQYL